MGSCIPCGCGSSGSAVGEMAVGVGVGATVGLGDGVAVGLTVTFGVAVLGSTKSVLVGPSMRDKMGAPAKVSCVYRKKDTHPLHSP